MDKPVAKTCGCKMEPVNDEHDECDLCSEATGMHDGTGWVIVYCPLHAAAPALLEALEQATDDETSPVYHSRGCSQHLKGRMGSIRRPCDCGFVQWLGKARAAIAQAKGETK